VEVAESHESADAGEDTAPRGLTLKQRMAAIRKECSGVGKDDIKMQNKERTKEWTIKGHTIEGVLHGVRGLLDKYRVWVNPNLESVSYNGNRCDVVVNFIWENLDDPEDMLSIRWAGADTDMGGKAFAKAGTNALKEMLKKTFLITDREDAKEETEVIEHQTDEGMNRAKVEAAKEQARQTQQRWAASLKSSIETCPDVKTLKQIKRENSEGLADLPTVTRAFFEDLFAERERVLGEAD
jgi:hypothetical protein